MTARPASIGGIDRYLEAFGDWTPEVVVFDCDGILLDTESIWERTQATMLSRYGVAVEDTILGELHGSTLEQAAAAIAGPSGRDPDLVLRETREQFLSDLSGELRIMPGVPRLLEEVSARVSLGCASNSAMSELEDKLRRSGLRDHFSVLRSTDTVASPKPAPDMYIEAVRELGADPSRALAVEDSRAGARAALSGGLRLLAVPESGTRIDGADLVLDSLEDPGLLEWIRTWPRRVAA